MISTFEQLPTLEELNDYIIKLHQLHENQDKEKNQKLNGYENEIKLLKAQIQILNYKLFGRKSEKLSREEEGQARLFDEIEAGTEDNQETANKESVTVKSHTRKKNGRRPIPEELPREETIIDLPDEEKIDRNGKALKYIGDEVSEKLDVIPASIIVRRTVRRKYAAEYNEMENEESEIKTAPLPPQIIPQGIATPGLLAYIAVSKFCDALPLYRQEKIFKRIGIDMARSTMCSWFIDIHKRYGLSRLMEMDIPSYSVLGIDETTVQVQREPGRSNTTKSYMWVFRGSGERPLLYYRYAPTRSPNEIKELLKDYKGTIQTDGYVGYEYFGRQEGITHAGCWAHSRRNFYDATKGCPNAEFSRAVVDVIKGLYAVEDEAREKNLSAEETAALRQEKSRPIVERIKKMLEKRSGSIAPKSPTGKAIRYALERWETFCVYLYDGRIPIDNNFVENSIRPFVVGRRNWLFSGSPNGAQASAMFYSLIETAKANGMEPYWYLRYLFEKLPYAKTDEEKRALLPHVIDPSIIDKFRQDGVA